MIHAWLIGVRTFDKTTGSQLFVSSLSSMITRNTQQAACCIVVCAHVMPQMAVVGPLDRMNRTNETLSTSAHEFPQQQQELGGTLQLPGGVQAQETALSAYAVEAAGKVRTLPAAFQSPLIIKQSLKTKPHTCRISRHACQHTLC
jgi:hypothetical protein